MGDHAETGWPSSSRRTTSVIPSGDVILRSAILVSSRYPVIDHRQGIDPNMGSSQPGSSLIPTPHRTPLDLPAGGRGWGELGDRLAGAGDNHLFAVFYGVDQLGSSIMSCVNSE